MPILEDRVLHQIWLGGEIKEPLADYHFQAVRAAESRDFIHRLWTERDLADLPLYTALAEGQESPATRAAIGRLCILSVHGGIYADMDLEILDSSILVDAWEWASTGAMVTAGANNLGHYCPGQDYLLAATRDGDASRHLYDFLDTAHFGPAVFGLGHVILLALGDIVPLIVLPPHWTPWNTAALPISEQQRARAKAIHHAAGSWHTAATKAGILSTVEP